MFLMLIKLFMSAYLPETFFLKKKSAIVVGGSGQIGNETCNVLIEAGATVINVDLIENKNKALTANPKYFFFKCDITNEKKILSLKKKIFKKFQKINILVNHTHFKGNPRILKPHNDFFTDIENYSYQIWRKTLAVNLDGLFLTTKHFLPLLIKNKNSVILNTSSTYGLVSPNKSIYGSSGINSPISYATTKSAIIGFTNYVATHYADKGVRANVLVPGGIENVSQTKEFKKKYSRLTPLKRLAKKNEFRETVLFMVSDASSYMTGSKVVVDGGFTTW